MMQRRLFSNAAMAALRPALKPFSQVPHFKGRMLPFLGSIPAMATMKTPDGKKIDPSDQINASKHIYNHYKEKGTDVMKIGIPVMGKGITGELVYVFRPEFMEKVLHHQSAHPAGGIEGVWPLGKSFQQPNFHTSGFWKRGEAWKKYRLHLQNGLTGPKDSRRSCPNIVQAARLAMGYAGREENFHAFCVRTAFDMVASVLLGRMTQTADLDTPCDPKDLQFQQNVLRATDDLTPMLQNPLEFLQHAAGMTSKKQKIINDVMAQTVNRSLELIDDLLEKAERDELTDLQKSCYAMQSYERVKNGTVTKREFAELLGILLFAGVDTTSALIHNICFELARNPECQDKLYEELLEVLGEDASVTQDMNFKKSFPYLYAVIRETQRTSPAVVGVMKTPSEDIELGGYLIPEGTLVAFQPQGVVQDPELVDNPELFQPERWHEDAVAARKGTAKEIIDHKLLATPFSAGARMCPGARIANLEIVVFLTEFIRKNKVSLVDPPKEFEYRQNLVITPFPRPKFLVEKRPMVNHN